MVASCTKEDVAITTLSDAAHFSTQSVVSRVVSSATSSTWESGDEIGISSDNGDANVKYTANSGGANTTTFTHADAAQDQILLPRTTEATYRAYYPYQTGGTYTSVVSNQSSALSTDFLIASGAKGVEGMSGSIAFSFTHALSMIEFSITLADELQDTYTDHADKFSSYLSLFKLSGAPTEVVYTIDGTYQSTTTSSGTISPKIDKTTATAIINPTGSEQAITLTATFGAYTYQKEFKFTPKANILYKYNVTLSFNEITLTEPTITPWGDGESGDITFTNMSKLEWGTSDDPFEIKSVADLERVGSGQTHTETGTALWSPTAHYTLTDDLDCGGATITMNIAGDIFTGDFDGNGKTIKNFTIETTTGDNTGLFPTIGAGGDVCNLTLDDCSITAASGYVGAIAGSNEGTISGCTAGSGVEVTNSADSSTDCGTGGITGHNTNLVELCTSAATVTGNWKVGGIVGYLDEQSIVNCGNSGTVTNNTDFNASQNQQGTGGIVGYSDSRTAISRCYNWGTVISSGYHAGGIGGYTNSSYTSSCYNTGNISGYDYVGGVAGRVYNISLLTGCYYLKGCVSSTTTESDANANHGVGHIADDEDGTDHTTAMESDDMKDSGFVDTLNSIEPTKNSYINSFTVYEWQSGENYPISSDIIAN